ncbi:hypothetical protein ACFQZ8_01595 [Micromonospora azadirachtae]|uniref:Uncharacterized protein n=1 Tax=Micromonospora azadirachtae TaxID=1970735 RepID=A0ABW2ZVE2_9ACTN
MPRRGRSTTVGKIAKLVQNRRASEIRVLGEELRREQLTTSRENSNRPGLRVLSGTR